VRVAGKPRDSGDTGHEVYERGYRAADEAVVIGPAPAAASYLNQQAILDAAHTTGADAVHPGYGFLSENADFAERAIAAGLTRVGPSPDAIRLMGDKVAALGAARAAGVPVLAGSDGPLPAGLDDPDALEIARGIGFPLVIKAAAGGGRGIGLVRSEEEFLAAIGTARAEAKSSLGDDTVCLERFVERARHVEVQILGDGVDLVHLGDRDCSTQRRSQRVVEEATAPLPPDAARARIRASSVALAKACGYAGVGTVTRFIPVDMDAALAARRERAAGLKDAIRSLEGQGPPVVPKRAAPLE
jgi:acetyl-CoA carboxylase, biotin carboxylase subunit